MIWLTIWRFIIGNRVTRALVWAVGLLGAAWLWGLSKAREARQDARNEAMRRRGDDLTKAIDVRSATDAKSAAAVRGDLGPWVRPGDQ